MTTFAKQPTDGVAAPTTGAGELVKTVGARAR
jgi:hypothetical protein